MYHNKVMASKAASALSADSTKTSSGAFHGTLKISAADTLRQTLDVNALPASDKTTERGCCDISTGEFAIGQP